MKNWKWYVNAEHVCITFYHWCHGPDKDGYLYGEPPLNCPIGPFNTFKQAKREAIKFLEGEIKDRQKLLEKIKKVDESCNNKKMFLRGWF